MENFQFDQLIEDIYKNIGKEDLFERETVAVRRDILNRLNQAVSKSSTTIYMILMKLVGNGPIILIRIVRLSRNRFLLGAQ